MEIVINTKTLMISGIYLAVNLVVFVYMGLDKAKAIRNTKRVPEAHFLFLSICFCAPGVLLGMLAFRHKIRKLYFSIGVPLAMIENFSLAYLIYIFLK